MPHAYFRDFESRIPEIVAIGLAKAQDIAIRYANEKLFEIYNELVNSCPPPSTLKDFSNKVNNIKSLISKADKKIETFNRLPKTLDKPIAAGKTIVQILSHMPLPSTIGTPPGPLGGVIISVPTGVIQTQSNLLVFTRKMVQTLEDDQEAIKQLVENSRGVFNPVKNILSRLEALLKRCTENPNLTLEERKAILEAAGNVKSTTQQDLYALDESYTNTNGTSYTISIVIDSESVNSIAPLRQAIAKDFRGIVVLRGPKSFAGDAQVLKDELKFRIDNQLP
jgi:hypothetical protein